MHVSKLVLAGIKCFSWLEPATFDFTHEHGSPHRWIVVYGDNGLGKSTVLRALGVALAGQPELNHLLPTAEGWVRHGEAVGRIKVEFTRGKLDKKSGKPRKKPLALTWELLGPSPWKNRAAFSISPILGDKEIFQKEIANNAERRGWLICGYGPHRRLTGKSSDFEKVATDGRADRLLTLFHEKAALSLAEVWLNELHRDATSTVKTAEERLRAEGRIEKVQEMLNNGLLHEGVQLVVDDRLHFRTPFAHEIALSDLSDGYRTVLALALDLLRRIDYCFGIENVLIERHGKSVVTAECVVVVDEIDSHLHPSWQQTIGQWLHDRFPNVQFIVATHSPLIATQVKNDDGTREGMVVRLKRRHGDDGRDHVEPELDLGRIGLTADQTLTGPSFGLASSRDVLTDEIRAEIRRLRKKVRGDDATPTERRRLKKLQAEYDDLAPVGDSFADSKTWQRNSKLLKKIAARLETDE